MTASGGRRRWVNPLWRTGYYAYTPKWWNLTDRLRLYLRNPNRRFFREPPARPNLAPPGAEMLWTAVSDDAWAIKGPGVHFRFPGPVGDEQGFVSWFFQIRDRAAEQARDYAVQHDLTSEDYDADREAHTPVEPNG